MWAIAVKWLIVLPKAIKYRFISRTYSSDEILNIYASQVL